jgi:hypothetical protein
VYQAPIDAGLPPLPQAPPAQQHTRVVNVQLPPFWVDRPMSWFTTVEARFRLNGVTDEQVKFDLVINGLADSARSLAIDVIERPPAAYPYTILKHRLLSTHELTDFQKIEKLLQLPPLGGRKPTELLAAMMEYCPRGQETNIFFTHLFLQRLPAELRILLGEDDHQDARHLARRADQFWALHGGKFVATVAEVEADPAEIAAVAARAGRGGSRGKRGGAARGRQSPAAAATGAQPAAAKPVNKPKDLAQLQSGLCFYHWEYGEKALQCRAPCNWGN